MPVVPAILKDIAVEWVD